MGNFWGSCSDTNLLVGRFLDVGCCDFSVGRFTGLGTQLDTNIISMARVLDVVRGY